MFQADKPDAAACISVERMPRVSWRAQDGSYQRRSVSPAEPDQYRALPPDDEERGQAPALLLPMELEAVLGDSNRNLRMLPYQNNERYHEAIDSVMLADIYLGRQ